MTLVANRNLLALVLDTLMPASGTFPAAGALALDHVLATAAASTDTDALIAESLRAIVEAAGAGGFAPLSADDREQVLRRVEQSHPESFATLVRHTYFAYYGHPTVIALLGLEPGPVHPRGYQLESLDLPDLTQVTKRGPIYRPT